MKVVSKKSVLAGHIVVPGSKSYTIRSLILAGMAKGISHISNPLQSEDCISTANALNKIGAKVCFDCEENSGEVTWTVEGAGKNIHVPESPLNVGNSGSLMYFLAPVLSTLNEKCTFTGDKSICNRPVGHLLDAFSQLGVKAETLNDNNMPPFSFQGPLDINKPLKTEGSLSQYISGFMMAATKMKGELHIQLENPKETPYLTMTKTCLEDLGANVSISDDFKNISVAGPLEIEGFNRIIPSDWEAVAFPLIGALISGSNIVIDNVDCSGSQGDEKIVEILQSVGGNIIFDKSAHCLKVAGNKRLSTKYLPKKTLNINISDFPDAICALTVICCFIEGKTIISQVDICRKKETDRVKAMTQILWELGGDIKEEGDSIIIKGHWPFREDGTLNTQCKLHGGVVDSYNDHRIAMALGCYGLGLKNGETLLIKNSECCNVSYPHFFEEMNKLGAGFVLSE